MKRKLFSKILTRVSSPEAIVVTGIRRVGKTTLLRQVFETIASKNKLFLDLENPIHQKYFEEENFDAIKYNFETLGINAAQKAYIFLDEIQLVKVLPSIVKYLADHYPFKFFLTGSSSFYMKNLFSESLSGRKILYELYPLDFSEFLELKGKKLRIQQGTVNEAVYKTVVPLYREYIEFGGFPGVVVKPTVSEKNEALDDIFTAYYQKEVLTLGGFRNNQVIRDLILLLASRVGSRIDVQKISAELGVSRVTIQEYLAFLEATYFIYLIPPFTANRDVEIRSSKKVYFVDSGLVKKLSNADFGSLFENMIFHQLKSKGEIRYYQKKSGVEIDFIVDKQGWEVKLKPTNQDEKRLTRLAKDIHLKKTHIISFHFSKEFAEYGFQIM